MLACTSPEGPIPGSPRFYFAAGPEREPGTGTTLACAVPWLFVLFFTASSQDLNPTRVRAVSPTQTHRRAQHS